MSKTHKSKDPRITGLMRDNEGKEVVGKAKRALDYAIQEYQYQ